MRRKGTKI